MGLFDKARAFMGGKGMANVKITVIERQPADSAVFPVGDSVLKGTMVVEAQKDCTLLATKYEVWLNIKQTTEDEIGSPNLVVMGKDPEPGVSYSDDYKQFPYEMKAGEVLEVPWMVMDVDVPKILEKNGFASPQDAVGDPRVQLVVKCIADVKGSPFDPSAEVTVALGA